MSLLQNEVFEEALIESMIEEDDPEKEAENERARGIDFSYPLVQF